MRFFLAKTSERCKFVRWKISETCKMEWVWNERYISNCLTGSKIDEVKSGSNYTITSLKKCIKKYDKQLATPYVLHDKDLKVEMVSRIFRCIWLLCYKATWGLRQNLLQPFWLLINSYCAPKHHHFSVLTENNPRKIYKLSLFCLPLQRIPFSLTPCWSILSRSKAITHAETDG